MDRIKELQELLRRASEAYYNSDTEIMSNLEYDRLFDELRSLEEEYHIPVSERFTALVGAQTGTSKKFPKEAHKYPAKSLDKTQSLDELVAEQSRLPEGREAYLCLSWKLDGMTLCLTYQDGKLQSAITRGDGEVGQNVTRNVPFLTGIPTTVPVPGEFVIRGEVTMSDAEFERVNEEAEGKYQNARNLANGTLTAEDENIIRSRQLDFRAFQVVNVEGDFPNSFAERLDTLQGLGFGVVEHEKVKVGDLPDAIRRWSETGRIEALGVPVDGLVVASDNCNFSKNLTPSERYANRLAGMAFKWKDERKHTILRDIKYQVGRTGVLTPVAIFDTVSLEGTDVSKASLHNISYIKDKNLRIGDEVTVYKANMIIPQIADNITYENMSEEAKMQRKNSLFPAPRYCPCCHTPVNVNRNNGIITLECLNEACEAKQVEKFVHAYSKPGLNIEGLDVKTIELMVSAGLLHKIEDIYHITKEQILSLEGFKEKSADNLLKAIEKSKTTDFLSVVYALGIPNVGKGQAKLLKPAAKNMYEEIRKFGADKEGNEYVSDYVDGLLNLVLTDFDFTTIAGIGDVIDKNIKEFFSEEKSSEVLELLDVLKFTDIEVPGQTKNLIFEGKTFVITGSLENYPNRNALIEEIESLGGKAAGSVSNNTSYLINNDITSTSGKNNKAKQLGVPIISEADYIKMRDELSNTKTLVDVNKETGEEVRE